MALEWQQTIVDARDPVALGRWWQEALGRVVLNDDPDEFEIRPAPDRLLGFLLVASRNRRPSRTVCTSTSGPTTGTPPWPACSISARLVPTSARASSHGSF
jgi:hypothetical protein